MKKNILFALGLLSLSTSCWADCPSLKDVVPHLSEIADRLSNEPSTPIVIAGRNHTVHYGETGKAVDDILAGHFRGHSIHRLEETEPGDCEYLLTDDNTPAQGSFHLKAADPH